MAVKIYTTGNYLFFEKDSEPPIIDHSKSVKIHPLGGGQFRIESPKIGSEIVDVESTSSNYDSIGGAQDESGTPYTESSWKTFYTENTGDSGSNAGLTDAELRATPVPVSGPLTDSQLRADPVPISFPNGTDTIGTTQTAINTDLLTGIVNGWYDAASFQSGTIQIIGSAGISAGAIFFEQTNDNTNTTGIPLLATEVNLANANPQNAAITIAASSNRLFRFAVNARYVRVRISTAFVGGNVRAIGFFSEFPFSSNVVNVQQSNSSNLAVSASIASVVSAQLLTGSNAIGDVGLQVRGNATGAPFVVAINSPATPVGQSVKGSAGRVLSISVSNSNASPRWLKVFNAISVTIGTTSAAYEAMIPPNNVPRDITIPLSIGHATGITVAITGARGLTDNTAITLNDVTGFITCA